MLFAFCPNLKKSLSELNNEDYATTSNFFDDGRMQIEQRNTNRVPLTVNIESLGNIPLEIPAGGVYLNFLSNPIKEIPAEY